MARSTRVAATRVERPGLTRARAWLIATQAIFFALLVLCVVVAHGHAAQNDGISYYGVHPATMAPLIVAYASAALGLWRIGPAVVDAGAPVAVRTALRAVAVGLGGLLVTPYSAGTFFNWAHMTIGVMMALVQLAVAMWLLGRERSPAAVGAFAVQLAGGIVAALSLPDWHVPLLLVGEIFFEAGFAWCLIELVASFRHRSPGR